MSSRTRRTLVATAPGGIEVTEQTAGKYDTAGLIQRTDGSWVIAAHGTSRDSVYNRTHAMYNRGDYLAMHVADLVEQTAPVIRAYFGTHQALVETAYTPGTHEGLSESELRTVLYAAGASLDHMRSGISVAASHPGEKGHAGVQLGAGIASVSYNGASFSVKLPAGWYSAGFRHVEASRSYLRTLARCGFTAVAVRHGDQVADFQLSEIIKSMGARSK